MNKNRIIKISEQFLIVLGLQVIFLTYIKAAAVPSFFLIWLLILTWEGNTELALLMAFIAGIAYDIISRGTAGSTSIRFLIVVYLNSFLKIKGLPGMSICAFFFSFLFFVLLLFDPAKGFLWDVKPLIRYSALFAFYNAGILYFIELAMRKSRWKTRNEYLAIL